MSIPLFLLTAPVSKESILMRVAGQRVFTDRKTVVDLRWAMLPCSVRAAASSFRERSVKVREARQGIARALGDDPVVEIGCGFGANARYCRGPYLGLDVDEAALRVARKRHPGRDFLHESVGDGPLESIPPWTVLLCAVLHEIQDREHMLTVLSERGHRRILVCDFDPDLGGWLRLWMRVFEPGAATYWGNDPVASLRRSGWIVSESRLTPALMIWDARAQQP